MNKKVKHQVQHTQELTQVLVAGGAGFIGSYLCQLLLDQNCYVYCLDNLKTGTKQNISSFIDKANFQFIDHDLTKPLDKLKLPKLDYVFHLAGLDNHLHKQQISLQTLLTNSEGTKNILDLAKDKKSKFLLGSSLAVFEGMVSADQLKHYFGPKEDKESFYSLAEAKRFSESLVFEYFKNYSLDCRIVRLLDVYGPRMNIDSTGSIPALFKNILNKEPFAVPQDGLTPIYPTFVTDVVYGLLKAMFNQQTAGKIYTLANVKGITVLDFAHKLKELGGHQNEIVFTGKEIKTLFSKEEIVKTQEELNWHPQIDLNQGIKKTFEWLRLMEPTVVIKEAFEKKEQTEEVEVLEELEVVEEAEVLTKPLLEETEPEKKVDQVKTETKIVVNKPIKDQKTNKEERGEKRRRERLVIKLVKSISFKKIGLLKILLGFFTLSLITLLLPFLFFYHNLQNGSKFLTDREYKQAAVSWQKSKKLLLGFSNILSFFSPQQSEQVLSFIDLGMEFLQAKQEETLAKQHLYNLTNIIVKGERGDGLHEIRQANLYLNQVYQSLSLIEGEIKQLDLDKKEPFFLKNIKEEIVVYEKEVPKLREKIKLTRQLLPVLPNFFSFEGKKTYLVLIQDNLELRPTGGFITAYGLLTFEKGKLLDFEIKNTTSIDSKLKGQVEPPEILKHHLNLDGWYLRDVNWSPDFPATSFQAQWLLEKEIGVKTDGVIALNLYVLQELLQVTGPVQLLNYNEVITPDNLFAKTIQYFEVDFSANNVEVDFISQLTQLMFEKIKQLDNEEWFLLAEGIQQSLKQKQLLLSFQDQILDRIAVEKDWNGSLRKQASDLPSNTVGDYLMVNEANLGINKVNYFLKRNLQHEVTILDNGDLLESLTLIYQNQSTSKGWPAGDYRNYLRTYIPLNSRLVNIKTGSSLNSLIEVSEDKIEINEIFGKSELGFLLEVPAQQTRIVKITYQPPYKLTFNKGQASYLFYWQKQPGWGAEPVQLKINIASNIKPLRIAPTAKVNGSQINFTGDTTSDNFYVVDFIN